MEKEKAAKTIASFLKKNNDDLIGMVNKWTEVEPDTPIKHYLGPIFSIDSTNKLRLWVEVNLAHAKEKICSLYCQVKKSPKAELIIELVKTTADFITEVVIRCPVFALAVLVFRLCLEKWCCCNAG
jgi:DNA topoisomerase IA